MNCDHFIFPQWDAPANIHAMTTTRAAPFPPTPADLIGDTQINGISWLTQVHGKNLIELTSVDTDLPEADGSFTRKPGVICVVKTADCLPILLANRSGDFVAALHCGWRGLYADLITQAVAQAGNDSELLAWIGPAISQACYEVDTAFQQRFCNKNSAYVDAFLARGNKYLANLTAIAEYQLCQAGVKKITHSGICSFSNSDKCHSFRRDGDKSGRMATLIWIEAL